MNQANSEEQATWDLEAMSKKGEKAPKSGVRYLLKIDGEKHHFDVALVTGAAILHKAGKTPPDRFDLYQQFVDGKRIKIESNDEVDLSGFGVEKFKTIRKTHTDGLTSDRRDFNLSDADTSFLDSLGLRWSTILNNDQRRVVIHGFAIPAGYNVSASDVSLTLVGSYPEAQIDMAYFKPALERMNHVNIPNVTIANFDGEQWQQWSRHRSAEFPWRPGIDDIGSHLSYVQTWLAAELARTP